MRRVKNAHVNFVLEPGEVLHAVRLKKDDPLDAATDLTVADRCIKKSWYSVIEAVDGCHGRRTGDVGLGYAFRICDTGDVTLRVIDVGDRVHDMYGNGCDMAYNYTFRVEEESLDA